MPDERWRPVPGWPGYEVSDRGGVRSVDRTLTDGRSAGGVLLRQRREGKGYATVRLSDGGRRRTVRVHCLVAEAFLGPRPPGMHVLHKNDDHSRNDTDWLSYGTARKNVRERVKRERKQKLKGEGKPGEKGKGKREKRETGGIGSGGYRVLPIAPPVSAGGEGA